MSTRLRVPHRLFITVDDGGAVKAWSPRRMQSLDIDLDELSALVRVARGESPRAAMEAGGHVPSSPAAVDAFFSRLVDLGVLEPQKPAGSIAARIVQSAYMGGAVARLALGAAATAIRDHLTDTYRRPIATEAFVKKLDAEGGRLDLVWDGEPHWQPHTAPTRSVVREPARREAKEVTAPVDVSVVAYPLS